MSADARDRADHLDPAPSRTPLSRTGSSRTAASPCGPFRRWRRSRPFWGGLLVMAGGSAVASAPLAPLPLIFQQGVAGVSGYTVGLLLVAVGALSWAQPSQRVFFGVAAVLLSLFSFPASNFGGFGVGMLLGLTGGALLAAWIPGRGTGSAA